MHILTMLPQKGADGCRLSQAHLSVDHTTLSEAEFELNISATANDQEQPPGGAKNRVTIKD